MPKVRIVVTSLIRFERTPLPHPACAPPGALPRCSRAVEHAAQHFQAVVAQDLAGFCSLSTACLVDILCCESLVGKLLRCLAAWPAWEAGEPCVAGEAGISAWCKPLLRASGEEIGAAHHARPGCALPLVLQDCPEKAVFDAAMKWAGYGQEVADDASACHPMQASWQGAPQHSFL